MIKDRVRRVLRSEEIDVLKAQNETIIKELKKISNRLDGVEGMMGGNFLDTMKMIARQKEFISSELTCTVSKDSRVLVCGFYGARNLGDEMMLGEVLKRLNKKIKATILLADNYDLDASIYAPHDVIHYPRRSSDIMAVASRFDVVIWGGGAVLDDTEYFFEENNTSLAYCLLSISKAVIKNSGKVIVLGVSSNAVIKNGQFIDDLGYVIENSEYFSLRDTFSLKTLQDAGVRGTGKIKIIDDLVLAGVKLMDERREKLNGVVTVGIVYIMKEETISKLNEYTVCLLEELKKKFGESDNSVNIELLSFYDYKQNDARSYEKIIEACKNKIPKNFNISIIDNLRTIEDVVSRLGQCDYLISMRYHATLIGGCLGINTLSISMGPMHQHYSNKLKYIKEKYCRELVEFDFGDNVDVLERKISILFKRESRMVSGGGVDRARRVTQKELDLVLGNIEQ